MLCAPRGDGIQSKRQSLFVAAATGAAARVRRLIPAASGLAGIALARLFFRHILGAIALVAGIALLGVLLPGSALLRLLILLRTGRS
jgi:hypothetical protein